tara:strand:+ start:773 stop:979 length:207 start_codon:yes stop_codon:yes gene_type:complete
MKKHFLIMLIGCGLPLLFIFIAPLLGITGDVAFLVFIIAMFACHLLHFLIPGAHNHNTNPKNSHHEHD